MVHGGILKHCRVVVTTIKVSLHDDDDEMMMVMTMRMRRARVVVTPIKVSHIGTGSRWAGWEGKQGWGWSAGVEV